MNVKIIAIALGSALLGAGAVGLYSTVQNRTEAVRSAQMQQAEQEKLAQIEKLALEKNQTAAPESVIAAVEAGSDTAIETVPEVKSEVVAQIKLSGSKTVKGVKLSWSVSGLETPQGVKLLRSLEKNPSYPGSDYKYLSDPKTRAYEWADQSGKTYHFRVCAYDGNGKCLAYSNDIALQLPKEESDDSGDYAEKISLSGKKVDDNEVKLSWEIGGGKAPNGFKVVMDDEKNPEYPGDEYQYLSDDDTRSTVWKKDFKDGKTYHFRVCVYLGGKCGTYSNDVAIEF